MYSTVNGIFHISIRINCNGISESLLCLKWQFNSREAKKYVGLVDIGRRR
jgi:hypothetical protein